MLPTTKWSCGTTQSHHCRDGKKYLMSMKVPDVLWDEAVTHAIYILNQVTTKSLKDGTPYEAWTGRKPQIDHIRIFGCIPYMRVTERHLSKLEVRIKKLVHLGVEKGMKGYKLLDHNIRSISVSRDVIFEENKT